MMDLPIEYDILLSNLAPIMGLAIRHTQTKRKLLLLVKFLKTDFNKDGHEDILWRYYGTGGYNRVWFLGNSEQAGLPLAGAGSQMAVGSAADYPANSPLEGPQITS